MKSRVVITGLGVISPVGIGKDNFWRSLLAGQSGIRRITFFDTTGYSSQIAGEVLNFDPLQFLDKKEARRMDRFSQFAIAVAKMAVEDAKLNLEEEDCERIGSYIASGVGGINTTHKQLETLLSKGPSRISPFFVPMMLSNMAVGNVAIDLGLHGPSACIVTACAGGSNAIGDAFRVIQDGYADVMLAGASEAAVAPAAVAGFAAAKALCTDHNDDPAHASRPFDKNRSGFIMGEGAGMVVLEKLEHAVNRGAHIYAEVVGYASNTDAYHITRPAPHGEYQAKCMALALKDAHVKPSEVGYINAHGTSTLANDAGETEAIKNIWQEAAKEVSVSSIKSMIGHLLGAAGAVECIATALTVESGMLPPTINYETVEDGLDLDYVPNKAKKKDIEVAISNSFGFGGHNACVIFKKYE